MRHAVAWAIRFAINSTTTHTPGQLAFGRDMVVKIKILVDWELFMRNKEALATKGLFIENKQLIDHVYHVDDIRDD